MNAAPFTFAVEEVLQALTSSIRKSTATRLSGQMIKQGGERSLFLFANKTEDVSTPERSIHFFTGQREAFGYCLCKYEFLPTDHIVRFILKSRQGLTF